MIKAAFRFNEDNYVQTIQRIRQATDFVWVKLRYQISGLIVFAPFAICFLLYGFIWVGLSMMGVLILLLFCNPLLTWQDIRKLRSSARKSSVYQLPFVLTFTEENFLLNHPSHDITYQWKALTRAFIFNDGILLLADGHIWYWVGYSYLEDPQMIESFKTLIQNKAFDHTIVT